MELNKFQEELYKRIINSPPHDHFFINLPRKEGKTFICRKLNKDVVTTYLYEGGLRDYSEMLIIDNAEKITKEQWSEIMYWATDKTKKVVALGTSDDKENFFFKFATSNYKNCFYYTRDMIPEESRRTDTPEIVEFFFGLTKNMNRFKNKSSLHIADNWIDAWTEGEVLKRLEALRYLMKNGVDRFLGLRFLDHFGFDTNLFHIGLLDDFCFAAKNNLDYDRYMKPDREDLEIYFDFCMAGQNVPTDKKERIIDQMQRNGVDCADLYNAFTLTFNQSNVIDEVLKIKKNE